MTEQISNWKIEKDEDEKLNKVVKERIGRKERKINTVISKKDAQPDTTELDYNRPGIEEENFVNTNADKFKKPEDVSNEEHEDFFDPKDRLPVFNKDELLIDEAGEPEGDLTKEEEDFLANESARSTLEIDNIKKYDFERDKESNPTQIINKGQTAHALSGENLTGKKKPWWKKYLSGTKEKKLVIEPNLLEIPQNKINSQLGADLKERHNLEVGFAGVAGNKADKFFDASSKEAINFKNVKTEDWDHKDTKPGAEEKSHHKVKREINYRKGKQNPNDMNNELKKGYQNAVEEDLINAEIAEIDKELCENKN